MKLRTVDTLRLSDVTRAMASFWQFTAPDAVTGRAARQTRVNNLHAFESLWWHDVVLGYGIAEKQSDGRGTGELCARFYVNRKLSRARLKTTRRIPRYVEIKGRRGAAGKILTDVVELPHVPAAQRLVRAGDSIGHFIGLNGTLGLAVRDKVGRPFGLTCAHVVAPPFLQPKGDAIESPADSDGKAGANVMGTLADWTVLDGNGINTVDAALVAPAAGIELSNDTLNLGPVPKFTSLRLVDFVNLRSTVVTIQTQRGARKGVIDSIHNHLLFNFGGRFFRFDNVLSYVADTEPGDSGSAVCDASTKDVLGLHFAGSPLDHTGYCIPSPTILTAFAAHGLTIA